ncbi:hypothetical protein Q1695_015831 [Nippostrongylus brasiliensis]|nr:hypothetical protein Q1695_015831 [Nippostrongylus brasiliensis]
MPFSGAAISMRCDIACSKCFRKKAGICLRINPKDECSHTCVCSGLPVWPSKLKYLDEKYCQFAKTYVQHLTKTGPK